MSWQAWLQFAGLVALVLATAPVLGAYIARVYAGGAAPGDRVFEPVRRLERRRGRPSGNAGPRSRVVHCG